MGMATVCQGLTNCSPVSPLPTFVKSFIEMQPLPFLYGLSCGYCCVTTVEPKKPKLFSVWSFTENLADPCCIPWGWSKERGGGKEGGEGTEGRSGLDNVKD